MTKKFNDIKSFSDLEIEFRKRIELDKTQFGIESAYLPIPHICDKPEFCFVAMEPSLGKASVESTRTNVERGYVNFLRAEVAYILHYCAYTYLCGSTFSYYLTDLSKGAMKTIMAARERDERYLNWVDLLRSELSLLGQPMVVAVGDKVEEQLRKFKIDFVYTIPHYSWSNSHKVKRVYTNYEQEYPLSSIAGIQNKLSEFRAKLLDQIKYPDVLKKEEINIPIRIANAIWKQRLFLVYRAQFKEIRRIQISKQKEE